MSMVIGGVTLDNDMYWEDEFQSPTGVGVADRCIDGTLVVQQYPLTGGQRLTLSGDQNHGWQLRTTVIALMALTQSDNWAATPFTVTINGTNYTCLFRVEEEPPIMFTPAMLATNPPATLPYYGTIKLRIVA